MKCPMCGNEEIEKAIFDNGRPGKYRAVTAVGFYCSTCNHSALVLIGIDTIEARLQSESLASAKFQLWEAYA